MRLDELRKEYKQSILSIADKYGAENIRVFGSTAREETNENSDVDFLVSFKEKTSLFAVGGMYSELVNLLGVKVDIVSDKAVNKHFKEAVFKDAVLL